MPITNGDARNYDQLIEDITRYAYADLPVDPRAMECARLSLLDTLGCVAETLRSPACPSFIGPLVPGQTTRNGFRLPGTSHELDPFKGAFDLSVLIRYLDHNDGLTGKEWGHPSDNIGGIIALCDYLDRNPSERGTSSSAPDLNIATVLASIVKAYEIQGVLQIANSFNAVGLDHVILVKVASTAVSSWLLGLEEGQCRAALSQAWLDGHPLRTYRHAPNAGPRKGWAGGDAVSRALWLAFMAKLDQPGAPSVLTTPRWGFNDVLFKGQDVQLAQPFGTWAIRNVFYKLVPAEGHSLAAIEAILKARAQLLERRSQSDAGNEVEWLVRSIKRVRVVTHSGALLIINKAGPLHNAADRDHCMQYILAVALLKGSLIEYEDYTDGSPWAASSDIDAIRACISLEESEDFSADYLNQEIRSMASAITLETHDGYETEEVTVHFPLGNPKHPETSNAVHKKSQGHLNRLLGTERTEKLLEILNRDEASVSSELIPMLWFGAVS